MSAPLVSFVVPCYNYGRYLRDCIDRILALEGGYDIEIVAVNDGSPDNTIEILQSYNDPRLQIIDRRENRGHIFTVNEGFQAARGKYIVRIDPDDRHHPHFLTKTVPVLEAEPNVGLAYGNINIIGADGETTEERADRQHGGKDYRGNELVALLKCNFICAPTVIARREAWMAAWPVPEGLAFNDWYFNLMLARRWNFFYSDEVLADYRVHGSNHHVRVSRDGSEEKSILWLLSKFYSEVEENPVLEREKRNAKSEVYASQYLDFANKYFGFEMNHEARRCYLQAIKNNPRLLANGGILRRLLASFVPRKVYEKIKDSVRQWQFWK